MSDTTRSAAALALTRAPASANSVAASISTASAPGLAPAALEPASVVEQVGGNDRARVDPVLVIRGRTLRERRIRGCDHPLRAAPGLAVTRSPAPRARLVPSATIASVDDHEVAQLRALPGAPRMCRPGAGESAPRSISSWMTIAALGPPIPVLWIVSGSPSGASPVYPHRPRLWLNIFDAVEQRFGQHQRTSRVAGQQYTLGRARQSVAVRSGRPWAYCYLCPRYLCLPLTDRERASRPRPTEKATGRSVTTLPRPAGEHDREAPPET